MRVPLASPPLLALALAGVVACGPGDDPGDADTAHPSHTHDHCVNSFEGLGLPVAEEGHSDGHPPLVSVLPELLSELPLYADIATKEVHPALQAFAPAFELWSDGADKTRWVYLPECDGVDTSQMDDWSLPVGALLFKEFAIDGQRIETRILARLGPGDRDFAYASYLWEADESDAQLVGPDGLTDVLGTRHDIPSLDACLRCHGTHEGGGGRPSRALGFSAIQLAHGGEGLTLDQLVADGRLTVEPGAVAVPGDPVERAALGVLHANCGGCHNATNDRVPQVDLDLWLSVNDQEVGSTGAWRTAVDQPNTLFNDQSVTGRVVPGDPDHSSIFVRMAARANLAQMPPLGSDVVDADGLSAVRAWIEALP